MSADNLPDRIANLESAVAFLQRDFEHINAAVIELRTGLLATNKQLELLRRQLERSLNTEQEPDEL